MKKKQQQAATLDLDGKQYTMTPLTPADVREIDAWVRSYTIHLAYRALGKTSPPKERQEILQAAICAAASLSWLHGDGLRIAATPAGMAQIILRGIRRNHLQVTAAEIEQALLDPATLDNAQEAFGELNINTGESQRTRRQRVGALLFGWWFWPFRPAV